MSGANGRAEASSPSGESRYCRSASTAHEGTRAPVSGGIKVITPDDSPTLTVHAARVLLRILRDAARQHGLLPTHTKDMEG
jgi:hypothetical protein